MEVRAGPEATVPPGRIRSSRTHRGAGLVLLKKPSVHRARHQIQTRDDERIEVVVERIPKWRREQNRSGRARLVMVVHNLGEPLTVENAIDGFGLRLGRHVKIAIVVVAGVFLIEAGQVVERSQQRVRLAHIPVGNDLLTIRVKGRDKDRKRFI